MFFRRALQACHFRFTQKKTTFESKNILVVDASPLDVLITDFPEYCLDEEVSPVLGPKYLSKCSQSEQNIKNQLIYKGAIMGGSYRMFLTIPTSHPNLREYFYVHYLLDTGSPITTLTHRALCAIHKKTYSDQFIFLNKQYYQIGKKEVIINLSNPNPQDKNPATAFHNVNVLGMNFLQAYAEFKISNKKDSKQKFTLELVQN